MFLFFEVSYLCLFKTNKKRKPNEGLSFFDRILLLFALIGLNDDLINIVKLHEVIGKSGSHI